MGTSVVLKNLARETIYCKIWRDVAETLCDISSAGISVYTYLPILIHLFFTYPYSPLLMIDVYRSKV
jgi:hypothetical protein